MCSQSSLFLKLTLPYLISNKRTYHQPTIPSFINYWRCSIAYKFLSRPKLHRIYNISFSLMGQRLSVHPRCLAISLESATSITTIFISYLLISDDNLLFILILKDVSVFLNKMSEGRIHEIFNIDAFIWVLLLRVFYSSAHKFLLSFLLLFQVLKSFRKI